MIVPFTALDCREENTCNPPGIKYYLGLTAWILFVFLEYRGSTFLFVEKTTASSSLNSQEGRHSPQIIEVLEDLLLGGQNRIQLLLSGRVHL